MTTFRPTMALALLAGGILLAGIATTHAAGALAIGPCGAYGFAYDFTKEQAARTAALDKCTGDCKVVTAMNRNCAALAIDGRNACGAFGFAAAARLGPAQNTALRQCYRHGGKDCVIRAFVCDGKG
ncbi:MAG: hypothetical protein QOI12_2110 [Alphaproteobacteria bacterium]|nr:hypothetical protein [Alphaproteobacteria bacterium]